jgi:beta-glucosidase
MKGYFYWSLLDNFEWDKGFWPQFGLASVNKKTFARQLRPSASIYQKIIKNKL